MTTPTPDSTRTPPPWRPLEAQQRRVLGVLIEKAKTTPAGYPMTVHAIVTGCNQKNNRDPLMALDDIDVGNALTELTTLGAVSEIDWLGRVPKYKHHAYEWLGVDKVEIAVMTELLLRGAQALGELRGRAARMEPIADLAALKPIVDALIARGLIFEITPPGRGQIVSHNLYAEPERAEVCARYADHVGRAPSPDAREPGPRQPTALPRPGPSAAAPRAAPEVAAHGPPLDRLAEISTELTDLREEVVRLRDKVSDLEARLAAALG